MNVMIIAAKRTPIGKCMGLLNGVDPSIILNTAIMGTMSKIKPDKLIIGTNISKHSINVGPRKIYYSNRIFNCKHYNRL